MSVREEIEEANKEASERMMEADPLLIGIEEARKAIPGIGERTLLHAGPPITWEDMSGPLRGALIGAATLEGWASDEMEAKRLLERGDVDFKPCHHHEAVAPMAGVISPSMPVFMVKSSKHGNLAYTNMNEGLGRVLRYGAYDDRVLQRLRWMGDVLASALRSALRLIVKNKGGVNLRLIIAQALNMGDECHNRNVAGTSLFLNAVAPYLIDVADRREASEVVRFINGNSHFFLNLSMAASKSMADSAHGVKHSTVVTAISRNGTKVGIRVSGLGDRWFTHEAPIPKGLYFPGFSERDANPDIGDSTITETVGLGGAAMAASPAIVKFVGGGVHGALEATRRMGQITVTRHRHFAIPYLNFEGTPTGIDIRRVLGTGLTPLVNTGIAHKEPGIGQIGAGLVEMPMEPFKDALRAYADRYVF
ncbi:MAG: DUF1116 domain-containing protein [Candidatus Bathyarchaeia archaeon]